MELSLEKIQKLSTEQIIDAVLLEVDKIYLSLNYTGISKEAFYKLVEAEIIKSKENYQGNISYIEYIKNKIKESLTKQIMKMLTNTNAATQIINNYANIYLSTNITYNNALKNIYKLDKLFETYNYVPSPDVLIKLLESNQIITNSVAFIFSKHKNIIISGNLEKVFDNSTIILMIEAYCMINNIEIKESSESEAEINYETTSEIKMYLQEINKIPLLTPEEEKSLAERISQGDEKARKKFIESNLRLVIRIAKRYTNMGMPFMDLIQEGNTGLIIATDRFDVKRNTRFSTYAESWIKQVITRALTDKKRIIRIPHNIYSMVNKYRRVEDSLEKKLRREPTTEEIAKEMGISVSKLEDILMWQNDTVSITNTTDNDDDDYNLENIIPSLDDGPETIAFANTMQKDVRQMLDKCSLNYKEKLVIIMRFGLNGEKLTLEETGQRLGITRERARQIEKKALFKLRDPQKIRPLAVYTQYPEQALERIYDYRQGYHDKFNKPPKSKTSTNNTSSTRKLPTIYDYFKYNTKEQLNSVISRLSEEEQHLVRLRFGEDLNIPSPSRLTEEGRTRFYQKVVPKIKRMLSEEDDKILVNNPIEEYPTPLTELLALNDYSQLIQEEQCLDEITNQDYEQAIQFLKTPEFIRLTKIINIQQAIKLILKLGYIEGKRFSNKALANFLKIEEEQVDIDIQKSLNVLRIYFENKGHQRRLIK